MRSLSALKLALLVPMVVMASVLPALSTSSGSIADASATPSCRILLLDAGNTWGSEALDAIGVTYDVVSPSAFLTTDLTGYALLYIPSTFRDQSVTVPAQDALDALNSRSADIARYIAAGRGLVALSEPIGNGNYGWVPLPVSPSPLRHRDDVQVARLHPVNDGLTNALLSNWGVASHHYFAAFDSHFSVLATNADGSPVSLAANLGPGRIFVTGQDPDFHSVEPYGSSPVDPGARILLANAVSWASGCPASPPSWRLPWGTLDHWYYWQGPHATNPTKNSQDALDFSPLASPAPSCNNPPSGNPNYDEDQYDVYPTSGGKVYSLQRDYGDLRLEHGTGSGSDFISNGWMTVYEHLHIQDGIKAGDTITDGKLLGHPSCRIWPPSEGGHADIPHIHIGFYKCDKGPTTCDDTSNPANFDANWYPVDNIAGQVTLCGWSIASVDTIASDDTLNRPGSTPVAPGGTGAVACGLWPYKNLIVAFQQALSMGQTADIPFAMLLSQALQGILVTWDDSTVDSSLTAPDGTTIDPSTTDPDVFHSKGDTFEYYEIKNPQPGNWTLHLYGADIPLESENVEVSVTSEQSAAVGGIAELPDAPDAPKTAATSSPGTSSAWAALAGVAAGAAILCGGAWYARKRWPGRT